VHSHPPAGVTESLTMRSLTALKWSYVGTAAKALVQFVTGVALARLLGPEPFGMYSAVLLVTGIGTLIVERGFGSAVVQSRDLNDDMIRYVFTRLVMTGLLVSALLCGVAQSVASLFRYPALTAAIYGSALYLLVYSASVVPTALLQRDLDMKFVQMAQIVAYIVGYVFVGISCALLRFGAWSLIAALVAQLVTYVAIGYARVRHTTLPQFHVKQQQLATFGNLVVVTNLLNWVIGSLDNLLVGRLYGMYALGLYSVSYNLVRTPTNNVVNGVQGVLFPSASRAQENLRGLQKAYLTALNAVLLVLCPVSLSIALVAPTVVAGIYGGKWAQAETLLVPLALAMPVHASMTGSAVLWARGQVATELKVQAATVVVSVVALLVASRISLQAIAWTVFGIYIVRAFLLNVKILSSMQLSWRAFFGAARGGLFLGTLTAGTVYLVNMGLGAGGMDSFTRLWMLAGVGLITVTALPVCLRGAIASPELRVLLERSTLLSPGILRTLMQLYVKAC
jgi:lipopolysaccharide exporter